MLQALVHSRMGARALVGSLPGAGRPVGPGVGGLVSESGGFLRGLDSLEWMWICHYY